MPHPRSLQVFEQLTPKQAEALALAADGLTSKEIARELGISPHSVDKRIDAVRNQLGAIPRTELVRQFRDWMGCHPITGHLSPLTKSTEKSASKVLQPEAETLVFGDSLTFDERAHWDKPSFKLQPGYKPSDFGPGARVLLILVGALLLAAAFVLVVAAGNGLTDLLRS